MNKFLNTKAIIIALNDDIMAIIITINRGHNNNIK